MIPSSKETSQRRHTTWIILAGILLFAIGLGIRSELWRERNHHDEIPETWDEAHFTVMSVRLHEKMNTDIAEAHQHFVEFSPNQAPLVPLMASFLYYVFPVGVQSALYLNVICMAVIGMCVYFLAARYNRFAGVTAAATVMCMIPFVMYMSKLRTELPLAMMVVLVIVCLVKTSRLQKTGWSVLTGIFAGLAILTNPIALVYLVWPVLYCLGHGLIESRAQIKRALNLVAGFACSFAISLVWYMPNYEEIKRFLFDYGYGEAGKQSHGAHPGILKYPELIWGDWNGLLPAIIVAAAIALILALVFRKKGLPVKSGKVDLWLFVVWVVLSYAFLNTTRDQRIRFLLPLFPGACVLLGYLAASIRSGLGRKIAAVAIGLACALGLYYCSTFPQPAIGDIDISGDRDWKMQEIADTIARDHSATDKRISVAFLAHHTLFNAKGFDLEALVSGHDFQVNFPETVEYAPATASISEYAIYKTGHQFPDPIAPPNKRYFSIRDPRVKSKIIARFQKIAEFDLPDGKALLYKRCN